MERQIFKTYRAEVRGVNPETGEVDMFIPLSTRSVDRDGEVVEPTAFKKTLPRFMKRPILLASHNYRDLTNQIGEWTKLKVTADGMEGKPRYYVGEGNEQADWGFNLASKGMAAFSIGFIPKVWRDGQNEKEPRRTYEEVELLEVSHVIVPSNRDAIQGMRSKGLDPVVSALLNEVEATMDIDEAKDSTTTTDTVTVTVSIDPDELKDTVTKPEVTEDYIRIPVDRADHSGHQIRTITISEGKGIKALYCTTDKKNITYLFARAKGWTMEKAKAWVKEHEKSSQGEIMDELDYLGQLVDEGEIDANEILGVLDGLRRHITGDSPDNITNTEKETEKDMDKNELLEILTPMMDEVKGLTAKVNTLSTQVEGYGDAVDKRFTQIEVGDGPEDKILADKLGGFKSAAHFISELIEEGRTHQAPDTLKAWDAAVRAKDMEEGSLSAGGYLVPTQVATRILEKTIEGAIVRPRAQYQPMASNRITMAADVDEDHSSGAFFGGVTIYRPGEAGQKTASNPTVSQIALTLHKVTGLCHVSDELMDDSVTAIEAYVTRKFAAAIGFVQDYDFINGTGVNQPLGIISASNPCLVTVTAESGQGTGTIVAENIIKMYARSSNKNNAVWLANDDTFPQLATMALAVGTGGVPVWMPANGISGSPYNTLMGRPVIFTEKAQTVGTAGDIILADLSQYIIGEKGGLQIASSMHFKFDYDQQSFRFVLRYDGQPTWKSALTPRVSSATLSPFVVLNSTRT